MLLFISSNMFNTVGITSQLTDMLVASKGGQRVSKGGVTKNFTFKFGIDGVCNNTNILPKDIISKVLKRACPRTPSLSYTQWQLYPHQLFRCRQNIFTQNINRGIRSTPTLPLLVYFKVLIAMSKN